MTKDDILHFMTTARQHWEEHWQTIDLTHASETTEPGVMNLRDIVYHVTWYEREMVELLLQRALVGSPWWELPLDERNSNILAEGQALSLLAAYHQEQQVYAQLHSLLNKLSDEELDQSRFFRDMPPDWHPWEVIASNTYEHYHQHLKDIH